MDIEDRDMDIKNSSDPSLLCLWEVTHYCFISLSTIDLIWLGDSYVMPHTGFILFMYD